jgi:hypothetical protein
MFLVFKACIGKVKVRVDEANHAGEVQIERESGSMLGMGF